MAAPYSISRREGKETIGRKGKGGGKRRCAVGIPHYFRP